MADNAILNAKDAISGALATCMVKIPYDLKTGKKLTGGKTHSYNLMMQLKHNFVATLSIVTMQVFLFQEIALQLFHCLRETC